MGPIHLEGTNFRDGRSDGGHCEILKNARDPLRSGVPVLTAFDITKEVLNNTRLADVVSEARDAIREGESVAEPLKKSGEFPPIVVHMIATGEKSGQLEEMLENVAENYDFQVDQKVESLTTLIEPIMIVALGVGVAYVVWAVLLPVLALSACAARYEEGTTHYENRKSNNYAKETPTSARDVRSYFDRNSRRCDHLGNYRKYRWYPSCWATRRGTGGHSESSD